MLDLELKDLLVNVSELVNDVAHNLSLPVSSINALLSAKINFTEVQQLLYGMYYGLLILHTQLENLMQRSRSPL